MKRKVVAYLATRDFYEKCVPSIRSLIAHTEVDKIYVLGEDDIFPFDLPVEMVNISGQTFFPPGGVNYNVNRWGWIVLMRAALFKILDEDIVLSLDADTIVVDDISGLWDYPIEDYYVAGAREPMKSANGIYINAGVSLLNLKKWRDGMGDSIIEALNTRRFPAMEQDAINAFCQGGILEIPSSYNVSSWTSFPPEEQRIIHFAAVPNWYGSSLVQYWRTKQ